MTVQLTNRLAVLAKRETTFGTDARPTAASNAMLVSDLTLTLWQGETITRNLLRLYFGSSESVTVAASAEVSFSVDVAGSGTAGTAPPWTPLLEACGFAATTTADDGDTSQNESKVVYTPVSQGQKSATLYVHKDGSLHILTGCYGSFTFALRAQEFPRFTFTLRGTYNAPTARTLPSNASTDAFQTPLPTSATNTQLVTIGGGTEMLESFELDLANDLPNIAYVNAAETRITGRSPTATLTIRDRGVGAKDYFALIADGTTQAIALQHGRVEGNIVEAVFPRAQLSTPSYGDKDGEQTLQFAVFLLLQARNDEIAITTR